MLGIVLEEYTLYANNGFYFNPGINYQCFNILRFIDLIDCKKKKIKQD